MTRRLLDCVKHTNLDLAHHRAFWEAVEAKLPAGALANDGELGSIWASAVALPQGQAGKTPEPQWLAPALKIIKEFEGCHLEAYTDPVGVDTIGWGTTILNGRPVKLGDRITQAQADRFLHDDLVTRAKALFALIPAMEQWAPQQQAALLSWCYNVGLGAVKNSTLRRRILAGENPVAVVAAELPRWNRGTNGVLPGLARRRAAELALFQSGAATTQVQQNAVLLQVPYELQHDNRSGTGYRECFSSSAAMVARFYGKVANDDAYNVIRARFGDTTDAMAQVKALNSLGLVAQFRTNATVELLEAELEAGRPVMVGWLHRGPASRPTGGGHWSVVVGMTPTVFIHHDPNGKAELVNGGYVNANGGRSVAYNRQNWLRRWLPDGPASGWCITVRQ